METGVCVYTRIYARLEEKESGNVKGNRGDDGMKKLKSDKKLLNMSKPYTINLYTVSERRQETLKYSRALERKKL